MLLILGIKPALVLGMVPLIYMEKEETTSTLLYFQTALLIIGTFFFRPF